MNKLFTKITSLALGAAMMIGVGVAVGSKSKVVETNAAAVAGNFSKVTGTTIDAGSDYLVAYGTNLMGNTVSSNRIANSSTTITQGASTVSNPDSSAVWTIGTRVVSNTTYYTFYNAAVDKYLLGNTSQNRASLGSVNDTTACWAMTASNGTFNFTISTASAKYLRQNGSYGWASYASTTGGALTLYKKDSTVETVSVTYDLDTGITSSTTSTSVNKGASYTTTISASDGYQIDEVLVLMGEDDITSTAYNSSTHVISIGSATGDIDITVTSKAGPSLTDITVTEGTKISYRGSYLTLNATGSNGTGSVTWSASPNTGISFTDTTSTSTKINFGNTTPCKQEITVTASYSGVQKTIKLGVTEHSGKSASTALTPSEAKFIAVTMEEVDSAYYVNGYITSASTNQTKYSDVPTGGTDDFITYGVTNNSGHDRVVGAFAYTHGTLIAYNGAGEITSGSIDALEYVELSSSSESVEVSSTVTLETTAAYGTITWTTANDKIATVSSSGQVTGVAAGTTTITATDGHVSDTCQITVTAPVEHYYVSFNANGGTGEMADQVGDVGSSLTLSANEFQRSGYRFDGWSTTSTGSVEYANKGTFESHAKDTTTELFAVWSEDHSVVVSTTMTAYTTEHSCTISSGSNVTMYKTLELDSVLTMSTTGDDNCGSFWSGVEWRLYQNKNGNVIFTVPTGYYLTSISITFNISNTGALFDGENQISSGQTVEFSGTTTTSKTFTVGNSGTATNGQIKITAVEVHYEANSGPVHTVTISGPSEAVVGTPVTLTASCTQEDSITWTTSDGTVATVSNGTVTPLSAGTVSITATCASGANASHEITVTVPPMTISTSFTKYWTLVEDASELTAGSEIIFLGVDTDDSSYVMETYSSGNNIPQSSSAVYDHGSLVTYGVDSAAIYTIESGNKSDTISFKDSEGNYIYAASSSGNQLKAQEEKTDNSSWTVSIDDETVAATILAQGTYSRNLLSYNKSSNMFSCYAPTNPQGNVYIYKGATGDVSLEVGSDLYDAIDNAKKEFTCDDDGIESDLTKWNSTVEGYFTEFIIGGYGLANADANESGNLVEQFLATYDYIMGKKKAGYSGYSTLDDFLDRIASGKVSGLAPASPLFNLNENTATTVIIIISVIGVSALGGFFFLRKRKEI